MYFHTQTYFILPLWRVSFPNTVCWRGCPFPQHILTVKNQVAVAVWVYFWALYSIPAAWVSAFVLRPALGHCPPGQRTDGSWPHWIHRQAEADESLFYLTFSFSFRGPSPWAAHRTPPPHESNQEDPSQACSVVSQIYAISRRCARGMSPRWS